MYIRSNVHTHSNWSDGKDDLELMVKAAVEKGFHTIGLSDHSFVECVAEYCIPEHREGEYRAAAEALKTAYAGQIDVLAGIEFDYDGKVPEQEYDYIIGSVHNVIIDGRYYEVDHNPEKFQQLVDACGGSTLEVAKRYYDSLAEKTLRVRPDVLGHFDLLTKFSMVEYSDAYWYCAEEAMKAVLPAVKAVEINTGAMSRGWREEAYPADPILLLLKERNAPVILSSDCHQAKHLDYAFDETLSRLRRLGFTSVKEMTKNGLQDVVL